MSGCMHPLVTRDKKPVRPEPSRRANTLVFKFILEMTFKALLGPKLYSFTADEKKYLQDINLLHPSLIFLMY